MKRALTLLLSVVVGSLAAVPAASASPLALSDIHDLGAYLACVELCPAEPATPGYEDHASRSHCVTACGLPPRLWNKDGVPGITRVDQELALLEYLDAQDPNLALTCYADADETIVVPAAQCTGDICERARSCTPTECAVSPETTLECTTTEVGGRRCWWPIEKRAAACPDVVCNAAPGRGHADCADVDRDQVPAWLEAHLGRSDEVAERQCSAATSCGFLEQCSYDGDVGAGACSPRSCVGPCTAFHLELVAEDDQQALVHVHYDFSPLPARVLDLSIAYDLGELALVDARPLAPLRDAQKELASNHRADGTLRLTVFDTDGTHPVPTGPIVELVFQRIGTAATTVAFVTDDRLQSDAIAPRQGERQAELEQEVLWGSPVSLSARAAADTQLRLLYSFNTSDQALEYSNVPSAEALCQVHAECANETNPEARARLLSRLALLQKGEVLTSTLVEGVHRKAAYLDGNNQHLRLPVFWDAPLTSSTQDLSFGTWFYAEGSSSDELKTSPQLLYTHNAFDERTRFGLAVAHDESGGLTLSFFEGDLLSKAPPPTRVTVASGLVLRSWHHVGFALDATEGSIVLYFDGQPVATHRFRQPPSAISCPQFIASRELGLHEEGAVLGGRSPEFLYTSARRNNLYQLERSDLAGSASTRLLGDGQFSYRDPDYSPVVDRLVYSSNASGSFEIWLARGDGSNPQQLTVGFGDADRGIAAMRPRWAPDGTGIVFESNAYDVKAGDNTFGYVSHLYYIGYDPRNNRVDVKTTAGTTFTQLDYAARLKDQTLRDFRLTGDAMDRQHVNAHWLEGANALTGAKGVVLADTSSPTYEGHRVARFAIPAVVNLTTRETVPDLGGSNSELELLAAHRSVRAAHPAPIVTERLFYRRSLAKYEATDQFSAVQSGGGEGLVNVSVSHTPSGYDASCWDRNHDGLRDASEDRDQNSAWDVTDCLPSEARNLWIEYDASRFVPLFDGASASHEGALLTGNPPIANKDLEFRTAFPQGRAFVQVTATSPLNARPLPAGELAVLVFRRTGAVGPAPEFTVWKRVSASDLAATEYLVKDLNKPTAPVALLPGGTFEFVEGAAFSPDGGDLLLSAVSEARPLLLRTHGLTTAATADRVQVEPTRVRGLSWVRDERYYACNWLGGYVHPQNKRVLQAFRGGLDDLRVWSGVQDADAFRSIYERGKEQLVAAGREQGESQLPSCGSNHAECPPYHLCIASECKMVPCDPNDADACSQAGGRCVLRPLAVEQENQSASGGDAFDWVCSADCNTDRQCFSQACLNGPCRFCELASESCTECRESVQQLGALTLAGIEGCPDRRSFFCSAGACRTECYSLRDGQSVYLCDTATEYCDQGRCAPLTWDWWDLGPASLSGAGTARRLVPPDPSNAWVGYTQAVDQRIPISLEAYGVADYGLSPEVLVEVKGGPFYGGTWSRVARVVVHNVTQTEARLHPYTVVSPHPFNDLRVRLVTSPYENLTGAATGLGEKDKDFCIEDLTALAARTGAPLDLTACYRAAQGSRYTTGYQVGIPMNESIAACRAAGRAGCPGVSASERDFLYGGERAVVLLDATVDGGSVMNALTSNAVCSYEGALVPRDAGIPKKVYYGALATERSNQKDWFCATYPAKCQAANGGLVEFDVATYGHALLNCNVVDPARAEIAGALFQNIVVTRQWPAQAGKIKLDTGDLCTVEMSPHVTEPCHSWLGDDVSLDPMTALVDVGATATFKSVELGVARGFGHSGGYTSEPVKVGRLKVRARGPAGAAGLDVTGLQIVNDRGVGAWPPLNITGLGETEIDAWIPVGRVHGLKIAEQPTSGRAYCEIGAASDAAGATTELMVEGVVTVDVLCQALVGFSGSASGLGDASRSLTVELTLTDDASPEPDHVIARQSQTRSGDGPFTFTPLAHTGNGYQVKLTSAPKDLTCVVGAGAGTASFNDVDFITVTCTPRPTTTLTVDASEVQGGGLVLKELHSGATLTIPKPPAGFRGIFSLPPSAGVVSLQSTSLFVGEPYQLEIQAQPTGPDQLCAVASGAEGVLPASADPIIRCVVVERQTVQVSVTAAPQSSLKLSLNGSETLSVTVDGTDDAANTKSFVTELLPGASYEVTVLEAPTSPAQKCVVAYGVGTIPDGEAPPLVQVLCGAVAQNVTTYTLGGYLWGLLGTGLRLELSDGVQTKSLGPSDINKEWAFADGLPDATKYKVRVSRQPSNPTQFCTVQNESGTVAEASVGNLHVSCGDGEVVSGTVTGLRGPGLELQLYLPQQGVTQNLVLDQAALTTARWSFTIPKGAKYELTIAQNPMKPKQTCTYASASQTVSCVLASDSE